MADATPGAGPTERAAEDYRELYAQVCQSYRAIDEFRMKLLGLLPLATGAGVLVILNSGQVDFNPKEQAAEGIQQALAAVALFGIAITLGLFAYEMHGIAKCRTLIKVGARIERDMEPCGRYFGQFETRPGRVGRLVDVPFASSMVYAAAVAVWVFIGLVSMVGWVAVLTSAGTLVILGVAFVLAGARLDKAIGKWDDEQELALEASRSERRGGEPNGASRLSSGSEARPMGAPGA